MSYRRSSKRKKRANKNKDERLIHFVAQNAEFKAKKSIECPDGYSRHHKKPKVKGGSWAKQNISVIPKKQHVAWHILFHTFDAYGIASIINKFFLDPAYRIEVRELCHDNTC